MSFEKIKHFLQYNNATIVVFALILLVGGSVLAAPLGKEALGQQTTRVEGVDNSLLLLTDFSKYPMVYKIEKIEDDDDFYYVTYTYNDIFLKTDVWTQEVREKMLKVSKKSLEGDLGQYVAEQLNQERVARLAELQTAKDSAEKQGPQKRVRVTEYSGLIGKALDLEQAVFTGYEPVKKVELPSPNIEPSEAIQASTADNLQQVYQNYINSHPDQAVAPAEPALPASTSPTTEIATATTTTTSDVSVPATIAPATVASTSDPVSQP